MPELCRFYGIVNRMYFDDHAPPHFHASYGGNEAVVAIDTWAILHGHLPARAQELVVEWASLHQAELREARCRAFPCKPVLRSPYYVERFQLE